MQHGGEDELVVEVAPDRSGTVNGGGIGSLELMDTGEEVVVGEEEEDDEEGGSMYGHVPTLRSAAAKSARMTDSGGSSVHLP